MLVVNIRYPVVSRVMHGFDAAQRTPPFHSIFFIPFRDTLFRLAPSYSRMHPMEEARIAPLSLPHPTVLTEPFPCCLSYHDILCKRG
jgi:hypothetical protein